MPQSFASIHCHLIFGTKNRAPLITADLQDALFGYLGGILRNHQCRLLVAGGMPDHVHLLVSLNREMSVAEIVRLLKANSTKWIHENFRDHTLFGWQTGYAAFAVSHSNIDEVMRYIQSQEEHHRTKTFQEELVAFLRRHGLEYDPEHLLQ
jgi:REP element-mobilizing transposase RayT